MTKEQKEALKYAVRLMSYSDSHRPNCSWWNQVVDKEEECSCGLLAARLEIRIMLLPEEAS